MAQAKRKSSTKLARNATRKPQKAAKRSKASKSKARAAKPHDAAGSPQSGSLNPYRIGGGYWAVVEALKALGIGKRSPFTEIIPAVRKAMGEGWKGFAGKEPRSEETGMDADRRILQNVSVLSRKDYGKPLRDLGYEVRWSGREKLAGLFKLGSE